MPNTREFTPDELEDLGVPYEAAVAAIDVAEARWGTRRQAIFQHEGKHWRVQYYDPATEMQEGQDIWEDQDSVTAIEVEAVQKVIEVTEWEVVD